MFRCYFLDGPLKGQVKELLDFKGFLHEGSAYKIHTYAATLGSLRVYVDVGSTEEPPPHCPKEALGYAIVEPLDDIPTTEIPLLNAGSVVQQYQLTQVNQ